MSLLLPSARQPVRLLLLNFANLNIQLLPQPTNVILHKQLAREFVCLFVCFFLVNR